MSRRATLIPSGSGRPGLEQPPLAEVDDLLEPVLRVRELALVDEEPRRGLAALDRVEDLVERHLAVAEVAAEAEPQGEERRGQPARDGDLDLAQVVHGHGLASRRRSARSREPIEAPCGRIT